MDSGLKNCDLSTFVYSYREAGRSLIVLEVVLMAILSAPPILIAAEEAIFHLAASS